MKTLSVIVLSSVALALAGCENKGGSSDQRDSNFGGDSNTNYIRDNIATNHQGGSLSPSRTTTGEGFSNPGLGTNDPSLQLIDPDRTNSVPQN